MINKEDKQKDKKFRKKKKCNTCKYYVDVGYKCQKRCLKDGKCDE